MRSGDADAGVVIDASVGQQDSAPIDQSDSGTSGPLTLSGPNWAVLDGPRVPADGSSDVSALRKRLVVNVTTAVDGLVVGDGYAARGWVDSSYVRWAVPLENHTDRTHCFVSMQDIVYRRADGSEIAPDTLGFSYIDGSIRDTGSGYTTTCVRPGETAYFVNIEELPYDELGWVDFGLRVSSIDSTPAAVDIVPTSYLAVPGDGDTIEIRAEHRSTETCTLGSSSKVMVLGADNEPLFWTFLDSGDGDEAVVDAGETVALRRWLAYSGSGARIIAWLDYELGDTTDDRKPASVLPTAADARARALQVTRNRRAAAAEARH